MYAVTIFLAFQMYTCLDDNYGVFINLIISPHNSKLKAGIHNAGEIINTSTFYKETWQAFVAI